jgi:hypothetical protein
MQDWGGRRVWRAQEREGNASSNWRLGLTYR